MVTPLAFTPPAMAPAGMQAQQRTVVKAGPRRLPLLLPLFLLSLLPTARAYDGVRMKIWNTTGFTRGDLTYELITLTPTLQLESAFVGPYSSVRFEGMLSPPAECGALCLMNLTLLTDGNVRAWVDDHLVLSDQLGGSVRAVSSAIAARLTVGKATPLRIEYQHNGSTAALSTLWSLDGGEVVPVPATALAPDVRAADDARWATRERLLARGVWDTAWIGNSGGHVHVNSGLLLGILLGDPATGEMLAPQPTGQHSAALVRAGTHSVNGSTYTQLSISSWLGRNCSIVLESAVVLNASSSGGADLQLLLTPSGADCAALVAVLQPQMLWDRAGWLTSTSPSQLLCARPGFLDIVVTAQGSAPVAFPAAGAGAIALPLSAAVGFATGSVASIDEIAASVAANRAATAASSPSTRTPGELGEVADALQDILMWQTVFSPEDGHWVIVGRDWDWCVRGCGVGHRTHADTAGRQRWWRAARL